MSHRRSVWQDLRTACFPSSFDAAPAKRFSSVHLKQDDTRAQLGNGVPVELQRFSAMLVKRTESATYSVHAANWAVLLAGSVPRDPPSVDSSLMLWSGSLDVLHDRLIGFDSGNRREYLRFIGYRCRQPMQAVPIEADFDLWCRPKNSCKSRLSGMTFIVVPAPTHKGGSLIRYRVSSTQKHEICQTHSDNVM